MSRNSNKNITRSANLTQEEQMANHLAKTARRDAALASRPKTIFVPNLSRMTLEDKKVLLGKLAMQERRLQTEAELAVKRDEQAKKDAVVLALKQEESRKAMETHQQRLVNRVSPLAKDNNVRPVDIQAVIQATNSFYAYQEFLKTEKAKKEAQIKLLDDAIREKLLKLNS